MADIARARLGPLRATVGICMDGRIALECGHKIPPHESGSWSDRMRCCFCPEDKRAAYYRERYRKKKEAAA